MGERVAFEGQSGASWVVSNDLSLFKSPIKEKQWTLAAKKSGKRFRGVLRGSRAIHGALAR